MYGFMTVTEAACYLRVTEAALYQCIHDGGIPHHRWGRKIVFRQGELDEWASKLPGVSVREALQRIPREEHTGDTSSVDSSEMQGIRSIPDKPMVLKRRPAGPKYPRMLPVD